MSVPARTERRGHVLLITLDRPEALNAADAAMTTIVGEALEAADLDPETRVVVITGAGGRAFCAGADIKAIGAGTYESEAWRRWGFLGLTRHFVSRPLVAAVNGLAYGGGNAYVNNRIDRGSTRESMEPERTSSGPQEGVVLVRPDRRPELVAEGLLGPNGSVVTPDGGTLIVAEAKGHRIMAYSIAGDGRLHEERVFAGLPREFPDGICLDAEGAIWFGSPLTHEYGRVREGGHVTHRIPVPDDTWGIAPALGGPERRTLFLCNAITDLDNLQVVTDFEGDLQSRSRGWIGITEVEIPGAGWP